MKYLKRLSDSQLYDDVLPWDFEPATPIPEEVKLDKKSRDAWINNPKTEHCVYTLWEGINPHARCTKPKKDGEGNPPLLLHGLAADYDHAATLELVCELAKKLPIVPNWIERTLSGNWRYVWLFAKPIRVPSYSFACHFLKKFPDFAFDPSRGMMGFDKPAWEAPERLWTNGCQWYELNDRPIAEELTQGWLVKAMEKFEFGQREFGVSIPLDKVKEALVEKYPKFADWTGEFVLGEHGPTFWVEQSRSPKSATVYENGMRTFSENATKTFYSWSDLLGAAFVKDYQARAAGEASKDIFYDGKVFWRRFADGAWRDEDATTLSRHLLVERGVSSKSSKDEPISEVSRILNYITSFQRVDKAMPSVWRPQGVRIRNGMRFLNTCTVKVIQPADVVPVWGPGGNMALLTTFLDGFMPTEQLRVLLAWIAWAYKGAFIEDPHSGQIMFIAGDVNTGKTFFNRAILGTLLGGTAEAGNWLLGNTQFNGELFYSPLWVIDDADASSDPGKRRAWSAALKRVAANREFQYNEKFRQAGMVDWIGRVCITMNGDEESARLLPDLDISNLDKVIILRTNPKRTVAIPHNASEILARELPVFARWLLNYEIPQDLLGDPRFGIKSYHEGMMLEDARQGSPQSGFADVLEIWRDEYFSDNPGEKYWEGTPAKLLIAINMNPARQTALGHRSPEAVGRALTGMKSKNYPGVEKGPRSNRGALWRIFPYSDPKK